MVVGVVAHGVGGRHPAEKLAHRSVLLGPQHQVPVIGHQLVAEQLDLVASQAVGEDSLEGLEVGVFAEEGGPAIPRFSAWYSPPASSARGGLGMTVV